MLSIPFAAVTKKKENLIFICITTNIVVIQSWLEFSLNCIDSEVKNVSSCFTCLLFLKRTRGGPVIGHYLSSPTPVELMKHSDCFQRHTDLESVYSAEDTRVCLCC